MHKAIISMSTVLVPALWHRKAKLTQEQEDLKIYQRLSLLIKKLGFFWDSLGFPKWFMGFSWVNMEITWFLHYPYDYTSASAHDPPENSWFFFGGKGKDISNKSLPEFTVIPLINFLVPYLHE